MGLDSLRSVCSLRTPVSAYSRPAFLTFCRKGFVTALAACTPNMGDSVTVITWNPPPRTYTEIGLSCLQNCSGAGKAAATDHHVFKPGKIALALVLVPAVHLVHRHGGQGHRPVDDGLPRVRACQSSTAESSRSAGRTRGFAAGCPPYRPQACMFRRFSCTQSNPGRALPLGQPHEVPLPR